MPQEIRITNGVTIRKVNAGSPTPVVDYRRSAGFVLDLTTPKGPSPGAVVANLKAAGGTQVNLGTLTRPTVCWIANQGPADGSIPTAAEYFEYGIYDPATHKFYPLGECGPGESYVVKLSRNIQEIYLGPGTGTAAGGETARLMLLANSKQQNAVVEAFEF